MRHRPTVLTVAVAALGFGLGWMSVEWGFGFQFGMVALAGAGAVQLSEDQRARGAWRIREALRRADIGIRKAALYMELDPSELERGLNGSRKLDLWRLEMLPDTFWREYWPLLAKDKGVPDLFSVFAKVSPVLSADKETA